MIEDDAYPVETPVNVSCCGCGKQIDRNDVAFVYLGDGYNERVFHAKQVCIDRT